MTSPDTDPRAKHVPAGWRSPLAGWTDQLHAAGRSARTIETRSDHIRRAARALAGQPADVTAARLVHWVGTQQWRPETRRSVYASLRGFFGWCHATGLASSDPAAALPSVRPSEPAPRPCPAPVLTAAAAGADDRVRVMLRLGAELGLRRAEIARVHVEDVTPDLLGWSLRVHGKGGRVRMMPISDELAAVLLRAGRGGFVFPGRDAGHLSARYVGKLLAGVLGDGWTAHTLRHRFGTVTHDATGDLVAVSRLLGHASVATTQRYIATDTQRLRRVAATAGRVA